MIKMVKGLESILVGSEDAKRLAKFYEEKVGLKITTNADLGENGEELYGFDFGGGAGLYIMDHSKVKGKSSDPSRVIINLEVDDIEKEVGRLKDGGVNQIQDVYHVEGYGLISTFEDLDGNYFQLVQVRES